MTPPTTHCLPSRLLFYSISFFYSYLTPHLFQYTYILLTFTYRFAYIFTYVQVHAYHTATIARMTSLSEKKYMIK